MNINADGGKLYESICNRKKPIFARLIYGIMKRTLLLKTVFVAIGLAMFMINASAQITGKFGTYYDQRELLFESLPTSENDIIFLGNSITDGGEWSELFQNPNCKNRGISGDIVPGVLNRLETVTKGQPAMIFLMIGTNDMNHGADNDSIARSVRTVVQRIKSESPRTKVIVQSILPTNDCYGLFTGHTKRWHDVAVINDMLKTMAEEEGVTYLDLYSCFSDEEGKMDPKYSNDGLHLNGEGYDLWKRVVKNEIGKLPQPVRKSKLPIWLHFQVPALPIIVNCYDEGTAPYSYLGTGANMGGGITVEWKRCHLQSEGRFFGSIVSDNGFAFSYDAKKEFLYRFYNGKRDRFHMWAGGSYQTFLDFKEMPEYMNASMGLSMFLNLRLTGMVQYHMGYIRGGSHPLITLYGKADLPFVGLVVRPGYAYMDNYTSDLNIINTMLADYETFGKAFPGMSTDVGLYFNLLNGNKIGLSYRWDYLTTGKKGIYRYDNAIHSFNITYLFNLN